MLGSITRIGPAFSTPWWNPVIVPVSGTTPLHLSLNTYENSVGTGNKFRVVARTLSGDTVDTILGAVRIRIRKKFT